MRLIVYALAPTCEPAYVGQVRLQLRRGAAYSTRRAAQRMSFLLSFILLSVPRKAVP